MNQFNYANRAKASEVITVAEFADMIRISLPTAYAMTEEPGFPLLRVGRKKLIVKNKINEWLEYKTHEQHKTCTKVSSTKGMNDFGCTKSPDEIKKALSYCAAGFCVLSDCPYSCDKRGVKGDYVCRQNVEYDALSYIFELERRLELNDN